MPKSWSDILYNRVQRRKILGSLGKITMAGVIISPLSSQSALARRSLRSIKTPQTLFANGNIAEIPKANNDDITLSAGLQSQVLLRWGDAMRLGAPEFDPTNQSAKRQYQQFGYNNDFIAFMPLPWGSDNSKHGLLCVNHEYTIRKLMFSDKGNIDNSEKSAIERAAHGHSIVEIAQDGNGRWSPLLSGSYNRRFNALDTVFTLRGPVSGDSRVQTSSDTEGKYVVGTLNNCAGGVTPWGTVLIAEENIDDYFGGRPSGKEGPNHKAMGIKGRPRYDWYKHDQRFNVENEPNEPNRFGWVVEYDPYDPNDRPVKRTALGRFKHEGATTALTADGRVVVYSGDDEFFQHVYKFISKNKYDAKNREANKHLLDEGTLYTAQFTEAGDVIWLPLEFGRGALTEENGFYSQSDVLLETRRAAKLLGATPMDRPEDIETNPVTGSVYLVLTGNIKRLKVDKSNPRIFNTHGHIIEMVPPQNGNMVDHGSLRYSWDIFLLAGDPSKEKNKSFYQGDTGNHSWLSCPDNIMFDKLGRMWVTTDGQPKTLGMADGLYVIETHGKNRGKSCHILSSPRGSEVTGPCMTPDGSTLFLSIQHPADEKSSTFDNPSTRWPDFDKNIPPRPAIIAITEKK